MVLVDDLGGWVTVLLDPDHQPADDVATIAELAEAIRGCAARVVLVSPEVGLSLVPTTPLGRAFTDALGAANRRGRRRLRRGRPGRRRSAGLAQVRRHRDRPVLLPPP